MFKIHFSIGQTYFLFEIASRKTTVTPPVKVRTEQNGSFLAGSTVSYVLLCVHHIYLQQYLFVKFSTKDDEISVGWQQEISINVYKSRFEFIQLYTRKLKFSFLTVNFEG